MAKFHQWSPPLIFSNQNFICISHFPHFDTCWYQHMHLYNYPDSIKYGVQIIKISIM
jgi:hypothetical protein